MTAVNKHGAGGNRKRASGKQNTTTGHETMSFMSWNINGWKGEGRGFKKIRRVESEVDNYDVFVLTETHLREDEEDVTRFEEEFQGYRLFHVHMDEKERRSKKGVTVGIKRNRIEEKDISIERDKGTKEEKGRWIRLTIKGVLEEDLNIWGIYAPVVAVDRKRWMRELGKRMKKRKGITVIMGDFNFVMDTDLDKIRGNKRRGKEGHKEQEKWQNDLGVFDVWRARNPGIYATTWTERGGKKGKEVKTRIDRILIDERIDDRVTETRIDKTKVSDHDVVMWRLETQRVKEKRVERLMARTIEDEEYQKEVKKIFDEEHNDGIEGWERFKKRVLEKGVEIQRKKKKKRRKDKNRLNKRIQTMRHVTEWIENARIQTDKGKLPKRWKRGNDLIRKSNTMEWMGKRIHEITDWEELENRSVEHLDKLLEEREVMDDRKRRVEASIERLRKIEEEDRHCKGFFAKLRPTYKKEEIFALVEEKEDRETGEKVETEKRDLTDMKRIATGFYKDLWKKRRVSRRALKELVSKVTRRLDDDGKRTCDQEITREELGKVVGKMHKGKSPGVDGIPVEFYQRFDFVVDWFYDIIKDIMNRGEMTETMRQAMVKLLFKKKDRRRIENYRPISLLCTDYKTLAKIVTERTNKVLKMVIELINRDLSGMGTSPGI